MTYQEAIDYLFPLHRFGMKFGLETMQQLCKALGNPERKMGKIIHVAGTNGKGSTASLIASIEQEQGGKVGLYTSPHLIDFTERMRVNGIAIPKELVAEYTSLLAPIADSTGATFFEITTAMAFKYFADSKVDISVVEVGMGGRLDATNVVNPYICVITPIGLDHTEWLGNDVATIASEKGGIIKTGSKTISAYQQLDALEVITRLAHEHKSKLTIAPSVTRISLASSSIGNLRFHLHTNWESYYGLETTLWADYQKENLRTAIVVAEKLKCSEKAIRQGIAKVKENTGLRGRLEVISRNPCTIVDVSHNPHGIQQTVEALEKHRKEYENLYVVFGAMQDKDVKSMLLALGKITHEFFFTSPSNERAMSVINLRAIAAELNLTGTDFSNTPRAIEAAQSKATKSDLILITGSFYLASEAYGVLIQESEQPTEKI